MNGERSTENGINKHPCPDCRCCQWCSDDRCRLCLRTGSGEQRRLSIREQIELYERNNEEQTVSTDDVSVIRDNKHTNGLSS